ncbi:MAG: hypothetical protein KGD67_12760 [Candidatus Lokiarchaeota archaeon]|nr:hypothetical protein [Candidatus Lokiarchaeota archaeon]
MDLELLKIFCNNLLIDLDNILLQNHRLDHSSFNLSFFLNSEFSVKKFKNQFSLSIIEAKKMIKELGDILDIQLRNK